MTLPKKPEVPARREREEILTIDEVAAWVRLPRQTLYSMRARGLGPPAAKLGKHLRYRRSDVERWIQDHLDDWADHAPPR